MQQPILSVIIPIFNGEKYIEGIFECFAKYPDRNVEVLLIDDGSKDNSLCICREKAYGDRRFVVLHKENGGIADTRNYGLDNSNGKYCYFCDQDDYVDVNVLYEIISALDMSQQDFCIANRSITNGVENSVQRIIKEQTCTSKETNLNLVKWLIGNGTIQCDDTLKIGSSVWNCVFRKDFLIKNKIAFERFIDFEDDWVFMIKCLLYAEGVYLENKVLYYWNIHENSESHRNKYVSRFYENRTHLKEFIDNALDQAEVSTADRKEFEIMFQRRTLLWNLYNECFRDVPVKERMDSIRENSKAEIKKIKYKLIQQNYSKKENLILIFLLLRLYGLAYWVNKTIFKFHFH